MKTVAIIQARMGSSRLPGKTLLRVAGCTLLEILVARLRRACTVHEIAVATTTEPADSAIAEHCAELGIRCVRGPERDVLQRFEDAVKATDAEVVVRITADSPLLDPATVDGIVGHFLARRPKIDYVTTGLDTFPLGMGLEVFTAAALHEASIFARADEDREHVTTYIKRHPEGFGVAKFSHPVDLTHHHWAVDAPEDFELIRRMLETLLPLKPHFGLKDCLDVVAAHPDWSVIKV